VEVEARQEFRAGRRWNVQLLRRLGRRARNDEQRQARGARRVPD